MNPKHVVIRDTTLREGLDTPDVKLSLSERLTIAESLEASGIAEIEIVAPAHVEKDLALAELVKARGLKVSTSGLVYSHGQHREWEIQRSSERLDRFDILTPVSPRRKPFEKDDKIKELSETLAYALGCAQKVGVGFPHATQVEIEFLLDIAIEAQKRGAQRLIVYDTNGSFDPFQTFQFIKTLKEKLYVPLFFHGHNDLGLASANSLSAVYAGADGLDTTVNGLGDRAGNASLEQTVLALYLRGFKTGVKLNSLKRLSETVRQLSRVPVSRLAPVVGEYIFSHKSKSHLETPDLFEAFSPELIGAERKLIHT